MMRIQKRRFSWLTLTLIVIGCSSNSPVQDNAAVRAATQTEPTSWHCEQGTQSWSCKRLTLAEIQILQAERKNRRFDWSVPKTSAVASPEENGSTPASTSTSALRQVKDVQQIQPVVSTSLEALPDSYWAVQLIALKSQGELRKFIQNFEMDELTGAVIRTNGKTYYVALLGVFENQAAAEKASAERPQSLMRYQPFIRSMASLKAAMAAADSR